MFIRSCLVCAKTMNEPFEPPHPPLQWISFCWRCLTLWTVPYKIVFLGSHNAKIALEKSLCLWRWQAVDQVQEILVNSIQRHTFENGQSLFAEDIYNENARMSHLLRVDGVQNFPNSFDLDPATLTYNLWPWPLIKRAILLFQWVSAHISGFNIGAPIECAHT